MTAPIREETHPTGAYVAGHVYFLDEVLPLDGLAIHAYAEANPGEDRTLWINFRMVEWAQVDDEGPLYPTEPVVRPGATTRDARVAFEFASGFLKWDGCCEIQLDHHMCGIGDARRVTTALLHLFAYGAEQHGFEDCE